MAFGTVLNGAIAFVGPYGDMMRDRPARYVKVAAMFTPVTRYRPEVVHSFDRKVATTLRPRFYGQITLMSVGEEPMRYEFHLDQLDRQLTAVSTYFWGAARHEIPFREGRMEFEIRYDATRGEAVVTSDGEELLRQAIPTLIAAPAEFDSTSPGL
jgi:hypothetical protein